MVRFDATKQRAGRSAISLQHILNKRKRYDPKAAKQQLFYAQAKQYKAYQRLLKREGYTTQPTHPHDTHNHDDEQQEQRQTKKRRRDDERQNEEEQDGTEQQQRRKERKEAELDEEGRVAEQKVDGEDGEGVEQTEQQWTGPGKKRRKRKEEPVVKSREQVQQEIEERQQKIADSRHVRAEKFKRHAQRTRKGQPIMAHRMEELLDKLKKQKQDANGKSGRDPTTIATSPRFTASVASSPAPHPQRAQHSRARTYKPR